MDSILGGIDSLKTLLLPVKGIEGRFKQQLPAIFEAMPKIVPCLLEHAQASGLTLAQRTVCLHSLPLLGFSASEIVRKALGEPQLFTVVCLLTAVCACPKERWPVDPDTWVPLISVLVTCCCSLLQACPISFVITDVLLAHLLPHALPTLNVLPQSDQNQKAAGTMYGTLPSGSHQIRKACPAGNHQVYYDGGCQGAGWQQ